MSITKIINISTGLKVIISGALLLVNIGVFADHSHDLSLPAKSTKHSLMHSAHSNSINHLNEHGGQIYQSTEFDQTGILPVHGNAKLKFAMESRIGTDENKIFIKLHSIKTESEPNEFDVKLLYSKKMSDFWDTQLGLKYRSEQALNQNSEQWNVVLGLHGLAPYFFESDAYLYLAKDQQISMIWQINRDILLTQKMILKPYLNMDIVLNDKSDQARDRGVNTAELGLEARYEVNRKLMPYLTLGYAYQKEAKGKSVQLNPNDQNNWLYGLGLRLKF